MATTNLLIIVYGSCWNTADQLDL